MCHRTPLANEHLNQYALLVLSCGSIVIFFSPSMNALVLDVAVLLQAASIGPSRHFQDRTAAAFCRFHCWVFYNFFACWRGAYWLCARHAKFMHDGAISCHQSC